MRAMRAKETDTAQGCTHPSEPAAASTSRSQPSTDAAQTAQTASAAQAEHVTYSRAEVPRGKRAARRVGGCLA